MKINILFTINRNKVNTKGLAPLLCRLTFRKERKTFSTSKLINPTNWNSKKQLVEPPEPDADLINTQLSLIKTDLSKAFLFLQVNEKQFDVYDIYTQYKGKPLKKEVGVMEVYKMLCKRQKKLIGIDLAQRTYTKYLQSGVHLQDFIKHKFKQKDIKIKTLRSSFLEHYEYFLKTEKKFQLSTINKAIQRFRKAVKYAIAEDYLNKDPFMLYKAKRQVKEVVFLTPEELEKLEHSTFDLPRIQQVKDMFVFCCYTGLGFTEMKRLKKEHIYVGFDGKLWIKVNRGKTKRSYSIPLLPKAEAIMDTYASDSDFVLPGISNTTFNAYLKEIADFVEIKINLTHHIARKTFASTVLLYNDVPMDVVSKLLGHSKLQTTQDHYGKIVESRIAREMERLS
jgi:integrase